MFMAWRSFRELGCRVKASGRVQYVNNNDSETYRKIPMQIDLHPANQERCRLRRKKMLQLASLKSPFLPVQLVGTMGKLLIRSHTTHQDMKLDWLLSEGPEGIQFFSTHGHVLVANPNGDVTAISAEDQDSDSPDLDIDLDEIKKWTYFTPCHTSEDRSQLNRKDLWVMRTHHGTFLTANSIDHRLSCTRLPSFWQPNGDNLSLICTSDTPPRRHHYRKSWKFQTYDYVMGMRSRFLTFSLGRATLFQALNWIHQFPASPFHSWSQGEEESGASLRTLSFVMAETARDEGFPDWVQLVALFHELGEAVKVLDPATKDMAESVYDWTISSRSRVVGCKVPDCASFQEFRHLNTDEDDLRYNSDVGAYSHNCGLDNVYLMWSGCEYTYHLLKHNGSLPEEGLAMIRYFLLGDWHEQNQYRAITNEDDEDILPFVSEFDALRRRVRLKYMDFTDLSDEQCQNLWEGHYAIIASKYGCDHAFDW
jgi:inositol oxygenase